MGDLKQFGQHCEFRPVSLLLSMKCGTEEGGGEAGQGQGPGLRVAWVPGARGHGWEEGLRGQRTKMHGLTRKQPAAEPRAQAARRGTRTAVSFRG